MAGRLAPVRLRSVIVPALSALLLAVVTVLALATPAPTAAAQADNPGKGLAKDHAKGVVIVGYEPGASKVKRGQAAVSVEATDVTAISPLAPNTVVMKLPPGQTVEEAIAELEQQPGVRYAEPDYYVEPAVVPNDPYYTNGSLWGMHGDAISPTQSIRIGSRRGLGGRCHWLPARLRRRHRRRRQVQPACSPTCGSTRREYRHSRSG